MTESKRRITICDGYVDTFAESFESTQGVFGESFNALGPYEVSASRNAVCVHHATLRDDADVDAFVGAVLKAKESARRLSTEDRGNYQSRSGETSELDVLRAQLREMTRQRDAGRLLGEFWTALSKDGELRNSYPSIPGIPFSPHLFSEKGQHCDSNAAGHGYQVVRVEVRLAPTKSGDAP